MTDTIADLSLQIILLEKENTLPNRLYQILDLLNDEVKSLSSSIHELERLQTNLLHPNQQP